VQQYCHRGSSEERRPALYKGLQKTHFTSIHMHSTVPVPHVTAGTVPVRRKQLQLPHASRLALMLWLDGMMMMMMMMMIMQAACGPLHTHHNRVKG
jgi:hypothetical protein